MGVRFALSAAPGSRRASGPRPVGAAHPAGVPLRCRLDPAHLSEFRVSEAAFELVEQVTVLF